VLDTMVFAVIDPGDLRWFGGPPIAWSAVAIYTVTFLIFWAAISTAGGITAWLEIGAPGPDPQTADASSSSSR
jgi:hypothetical protein